MTGICYLPADRNPMRAVAAGATAIATAKPGAQTDLVKRQGGQHVVDPTQDLAAQVKAIAPNAFNGILHLAGDASALPELLAADGEIASALGFSPDKHPAAVAAFHSDQFYKKAVRA